ncbi:hypothetical protein ABPG72_004971 [Tetrahymena utriculariae]
MSFQNIQSQNQNAENFSDFNKSLEYCESASKNLIVKRRQMFSCLNQESINAKSESTSSSEKEYHQGEQTLLINNKKNQIQHNLKWGKLLKNNNNEISIKKITEQDFDNEVDKQKRFSIKKDADLLKFLSLENQQISQEEEDFFEIHGYIIKSIQYEEKSFIDIKIKLEQNFPNFNIDQRIEFVKEINKYIQEKKLNENKSQNQKKKNWNNFLLKKMKEIEEYYKYDNDSSKILYFPNLKIDLKTFKPLDNDCLKDFTNDYNWICKDMEQIGEIFDRHNKKKLAQNEEFKVKLEKKSMLSEYIEQTDKSYTKFLEKLSKEHSNLSFLYVICFTLESFLQDQNQQEKAQQVKAEQENTNQGQKQQKKAQQKEIQQIQAEQEQKKAQKEKTYQVKADKKKTNQLKKQILIEAFKTFMKLQFGLEANDYYFLKIGYSSNIKKRCEQHKKTYESKILKIYRCQNEQVERDIHNSEDQLLKKHYIQYLKLKIPDQKDNTKTINTKIHLDGKTELYVYSKELINYLDDLKILNFISADDEGLGNIKYANKIDKQQQQQQQQQQIQIIKEQAQQIDQLKKLVQTLQAQNDQLNKSLIDANRLKEEQNLKHYKYQLQKGLNEANDHKNENKELDNQVKKQQTQNVQQKKDLIDGNKQKRK